MSTDDFRKKHGTGSLQIFLKKPYPCFSREENQGKKVFFYLPISSFPAHMEEILSRRFPLPG